MFYILFSSLFFLPGCDEDKIIYNSGHSPEEEIEQQDSTHKRRINFSAQLLTYTTKNTSSPLLAERYATVYAFDNSTLSAQVKYYTKEAGTLTPVNSAMYLPTGEYDLYAVGVNRPNVVLPSFSDGICNMLANNTDYIWWGTEDVAPLYPVSNYEIDFQHCCTQVVMQIDVESGIEVNDFGYITLTPSDISNVSWNLFYGTIGPSATISLIPDSAAYVKVNDSTFLAQMIMAPIRVQNKISMTVSFALRINNEEVTRIYDANLPVYDMNMKPGHSYYYDLLVRTDTVVINEINIVNWVNVDVNNKPIIPTESD